MGDESSIRLAFHLCTDKISILHWSWLYNHEREQLGFPHVMDMKRRHVRRISEQFLSYSALREGYNNWGSLDYLEHIKT